MGSFAERLRALLCDPRAGETDLGDVRVREVHRRLIAEKAFLRRIYSDWYDAIVAELPPVPAPILEIGSGAGHLATRIPGLLTSDIVTGPDLRLTANATSLPFRDGALGAIVLVNAFHHLADVGRFLDEAARCVAPGGALLLVDPWCSAWSRWIYPHFHHEPFDAAATDWRTRGVEPLEGANGALAWIVFSRDRERFERDHPEWRMGTLRPMMPFSYLLSGGLSMRPLAPRWAFRGVRIVEDALSRLTRQLSMFALVVLHRRGGRQEESAGTVADRRIRNEIDHGRRLATVDPATVWGWGSPAGQERFARRSRAIVDGAAIGPGVETLEIGCGTGMLTAVLVERGARVVAIDVSAELLEHACSKGLPADRVSWVVGSFETESFDRRFDAVVGSSVLHHLDVPCALDHIRDLMEPGGRLAFAEPNLLNPQVLAERKLRFLAPLFPHVSPDETAFVRWRLRRELIRRGFLDVEITPFDWLHPATPPVLIPLVRRLQRLLEATPILRELAGSLLITARLPTRDAPAPSRRLHLLPRRSYRDVPLTDPIRFYFVPLLGTLYRRRVELCLAECRPAKRVLEVGFGSGVTFSTLAEMYQEIHGIDLHADAAGVEKTSAGLDAKIELCTGSVLDLPYRSDSFDTVLLISVLEHLRPAELDLAFAEIHRVLKPGGQVVFGVPVERRLMALGFRLLGYAIRHHHFSTEEMVRDAAARTFSCVRSVWLELPLLGRLYEVGHFVASAEPTPPENRPAVSRAP